MKKMLGCVHSLYFKVKINLFRITAIFIRFENVGKIKNKEKALKLKLCFKAWMIC